MEPAALYTSAQRQSVDNEWCIDFAGLVELGMIDV